MSIGDKIKKRREELGLTQDELARRLGYTSRSTINKVELGKNDVTQSKIAEYAAALSTTSAYLLDLSESFTEINSSVLPVYQEITRDYPNSNYITVGYETLPTEITSPADYFALLDKGNTMIPFKGIQHIVIAKKQDYADDGDMAVILIDSDDAIIRQVKKEKDLLILKAKDPDIEDIYFTEEAMKEHNVRIIGVVEFSRIHW